MRTRRGLIGFSVCVCLLVAGPVAAEVRLPSVFSEHMVLQRDMPVPVWGWADAGEKVAVAIAGRTAEATAGQDGRWEVRLASLEAGGPHTLVVKGANTLTVSDVLVGEVWLASGQSNMNMPIDWGVFGKWGSPECEKGLAEANYPKFRMFLVNKATVGKPAADATGQWKICRGREILKWSAAGYFFGRELHQKLDVPVGILKSAVGGTPIESWMSRDALVGAVPEQKEGIASWDRREASFDPAAFEKKLADWRAKAEKAKAEGKRAPRRPAKVTENAWRPTSLYNGMIDPLAPYALRGAIWYQGESNASRAMAYRATFPAMIRSWRSRWGQGDFPFLFVQLANFRPRKPEPSDSAWAELREAQLMTLSVPNTAMAVIIDIGEAEDVHPKNKLDVGLRLARGAMKLAYGKDVVYSGPLFKAMKVEAGGVRLTFTHTGGGLVAKGGGPLKGFAVAGEDRKFVWAGATIDGDTVVVRSSAVAKPVAVRYAWADNPECNLHNAEGLPASPFRTDDWPRPGAATK